MFLEASRYFSLNRFVLCPCTEKFISWNSLFLCALVSLIAVNTEEKCSTAYTGKSTKQPVSERELGDYEKIKGFNLFYMLLILENP